MKNLLNQTKKIIIRKLFDESYQDYEKWDYNNSFPQIGEVSGTNGVEASADEVAGKLNIPLAPGEWHHIGSEIETDMSAGVSLEQAKLRAHLRARERRGLQTYGPNSRPGDNAPNTLSGVSIPITSDELMNLPVENWSNHDVGLVHSAAIRAGYDTPKGRKMAEKVKSWYAHHVDKQLKGPDVSGAANLSVGGPVHVDGYVRSQDGKNISVRVHTRSRPH